MSKHVPQCKTTVIVANPNPIACNLFAQALARHPGIEIVDCVSDAARLSDCLQQHKPKVLLVSIHFKQLVANHFEALAQVLSGHPEVASIVLLDSSEPEVVVDAFRARTKGVFVCADGDMGMLRRCIQRVAEGQIWVDSVQMNYLVSSVPDTHWKAAAATTEPLTPVLTPREEEVVRLLTEGLRNREIAARLGLSDNTVKNYIFRIFEKLGFSSRVEVILYATMRMQELREHSAPALAEP